MQSLDGEWRPFQSYPGYQIMAPCMRDCEEDLPFNGCDNSGCWCKKSNLDRRVSSLERCASTSCTFADMNTATDVDIMSGIQVQYCVDRDLSPEGMTMPSTVLATTTDATSLSPTDPAGASTGAQSTAGMSSGTGTGTRTRPSSGPSNTGGPLESSTSTVTPASPSNSSISTAAKAGIAIGAIFCILLAILLGVVLLRRRKRNPQYPPEYSHAPPPLAPGLYSSPPPVQQPLHVQTTGNAGFTPAKADVSPIEEKTPAFAVSRKEVGGVASPQTQGTPVMRPAQVSSPAPTEIAGSMPPPRHEVHNDAAPGGYADGGQGRWVYEMQNQTQGQGQGRDGVYELGGGR